MTRRRFARRVALAAVALALTFGLVGAGLVWLIGIVVGASSLGALGAVIVFLGFVIVARWALRSARVASAPRPRGAVASSAPATKRSCCRERIVACRSAWLSCLQRARATPSAEFASSIDPYASVRASVFATRPPYQRLVVPSSPLRV